MRSLKKRFGRVQESTGLSLLLCPPQEWPAHNQSPRPAGRPPHHPSASETGWHRNADWQSYLPRNRITAYLKNSGKLEVAQQIANHESPRTTKLYDRRQDEISLDEIERITI
jgi:hypothetical protein